MPAVYEGAGISLTGPQLYALPDVVRYAAANHSMPDPLPRSWCWVQDNWNMAVDGGRIDTGMVFHDEEGDLPVFAVLDQPSVPPSTTIDVAVPGLSRKLRLTVTLL